MTRDEQNPTLRSVLAHYADPAHWSQVTLPNGQGCVTIWTGPNVPPYELAQRVLADLDAELAVEAAEVDPKIAERTAAQYEAHVLEAITASGGMSLGRLHNAYPSRDLSKTLVRLVKAGKIERVDGVYRARGGTP